MLDNLKGVDIFKKTYQVVKSCLQVRTEMKKYYKIILKQKKQILIRVIN